MRAFAVDGFVYFTDGKGNQPRIVPSIPTLWAITHTHAFIADFGSVLRIP